MDRIFARGLAALIFPVLAALAPAAALEHADLLPPPAAAAVDGVFSDARAAPGYAVGIIKDNRLIFARGYGLANLEDRTAITPDTVFHLASLSKQFTAAAIALLILDRRISLDDPVSRYVPETAKYGPALRIKHLIYMTSGLHEYFEVPRANGLPWYTAYYFTRDDAVEAALRPAALQFAPGTKWAYSNTNYMLLTKIVEKVSGRPFASFMRERIFAPLGMTASLIDDDATLVIPHRAVGYAPRTDKVIAELAKVKVHAQAAPGFVRFDRTSPHFGGSGVFASVGDLAKWDANWYAPKLAGPAFTTLMNKRAKFQHDKDNDAFGLVFGTYDGKQTIWYAGDDIDASSYMIRFPAQKITVICLSNNPLGDAQGRTMRVLKTLDAAGLLN